MTAPISGVIASRSIKTGNFVQINTPIMRIVDVARLEAVLNVPERELATLKAGLPVRLAVDALPGKAFTGTVDRVAPVVDSGSGTFRVVCAFDGESLRPGMFGRIRIDYDQRADALVVPCAALRIPRYSSCATRRAPAFPSSWVTWTANGLKSAAASSRASRS